MESYFAVLIVLVVAGVGQAQIELTECPAGWTRFGDNCYQVFNNASTTSNWLGANIQCDDKHGHLLRVETADEYNFIKKQIAMRPAASFWTSLNDRHPHHHYHHHQDVDPNEKPTDHFSWGWYESVPPLKTIVGNHWDKEPNNSGDKDCVQISMQATLTIDRCEVPHGYICQFQMQPNEACPEGWTKGWVGSNRCYWISDVTQSALASWAFARKTCEAKRPFGDNRKASLLSVTSEKDQAFLVTNLPIARITDQFYWTGLNDIDNENNFVWAGNVKTPFNAGYIRWKQEPDNLGGKEKCGAILPGGVWQDADCDLEKNYICRITLNPKNLFNFGCGQWTRAGKHCVYVYDKRLNWTMARDYCRRQGARLYKFHDEDDLMWLNTQAGHLLHKPTYWIGLNDRDSELSFKWEDGSSVDGALLDWDKEPNDDKIGSDIGEYCAYLSEDGFYSATCIHSLAGSICEDVGTACMPGWIPYGGSCYQFFQSFRNMENAKLHCKQGTRTGNAHLLSLSTLGEKDFIMGQLKNMTVGPHRYWTDLERDGAGDLSWHYRRGEDDDPSTIDNLVHWATEPNDPGHQENCVVVNANGHLEDMPCKLWNPFICHQDLNPMAGEQSALTGAGNMASMSSTLLVAASFLVRVICW